VSGRRAAGAWGLVLAGVVAMVGCSPDRPVPSIAGRPSAPPATATPPPSPAVAVVAELVVPTVTVARPVEPALAPRYSTGVTDYCLDRDLLAPPSSDHALTILDRTYALAPDDAPADLVPASEAGFAGIEGERLVSAAIVDDLAAMRAAWRSAGMAIMLESAYRSYRDQAATFAFWMALHGYEGALVRAARPGHSEHQLGTALDLVSLGWSGRVGDWATESAEGAWMAAHGWEYGFVMSYPDGAQAETCFSYEPWHYRWVGREVAAAQHARGIALRRYLERFISP